MCIHIMVDDIYFSLLANIIHCSSLPPRLTRNSFRRSVVSLVASLPSNNSSKRRGGNQLGVAIAQKNSTMAQWLVI